MIRRLRHLFCGYFIGLTAAVSVLPPIAAMATGTLMIVRPKWAGLLNKDGAHVCLFGLAIAAFALAALALLCRRFATIAGANPGAYAALREAFDRVEPRVRTVAPPEDVETRVAHAEAEAECHTIKHFLCGQSAPSMSWLLGTGYVDLWKRVHRIEEALIELEPSSDLVRGALVDDARLQGSRIGDAPQLLRKITVALGRIFPGAAEYLCGGADRQTSPSPPDEAAGLTPFDDSGPRSAAEAVARSALRHVRLAINEFRDTRRDGLVRARNNLLATIFFTGITGYALLVVALLTGATPTEITAAGAFYLVGASVGLLKQLGLAANADSTLQEDFGFSTARLIYVPIFSGLAALGGVALTAIVPALLPSQATGSAAQGSGTVLSLSDIFNIGNSPRALLIAAVFGLSPNLLLNKLQSQVQQFATDLKSSQSGETAAPS